MNIGFQHVRAVALSLTLGFCLPAYAQPVTMGDITVDLPSNFKVEDSDRGMKTQTADGAVDVWFERYPAGEFDKFVSENSKYWEKNKVDLPKEPTVTEGKIGSDDFRQLDFGGATWKGKPTVVRYVFFKPGNDPKADMVVVTYWATPEGDIAHNAEIVSMIGTAKFN